MRTFLLSTFFFLSLLFFFDWIKHPEGEKGGQVGSLFFSEKKNNGLEEAPLKTEESSSDRKVSSLPPLPGVDRLEALFKPVEPLFPFCETVYYTSHVDWNGDRPAWLVDWANHYKTSRYFVIRSAGCLPEEIREGTPFNVFKKDYPFRFHLTLDLSRKQLWLGYVDLKTNLCKWIKTYRACVGRRDPTRKSGYLTPLGTYRLGDRVAVYNSQSLGYYQGEKVEMIRYFGTRWIPFEREVHGCTAPARSFGIHGVPWIQKEGTGQWEEDTSSIGQEASDGCIRLLTADIEEIYSVISTRLTYIEITHDFLKSEYTGDL